MKTPALLLLLTAVAAFADLPLMTPTRIVKTDTGGDYTSAMVIEAGGKKVFIKALHSKPYPERDPQTGQERPVQLTRWGNFESDILAKELFSLVDVQCPAARVVRMPPGSEPAKALGPNVLAMEFVDASFARGGRVAEGYWPGADRADVDAFINMALVDIVMGNADRRDPNYFVAELPDGMVRPIPIDNNSGFCTMLVWTRPSNLINFWSTYDGLAEGWPWEMLGTIANIVVRGGEVHHVHERVLDDPRCRAKALALAKAFAAKLTDAEIDRMCALVPAEVIPADIEVSFSGEVAAQLSVPELAKFVGPVKPLKGPELFRRRIAEIKAGLRWRRSNLVAGLTAYFRKQGGPIAQNPPPRPPPGPAPVVRPPIKVWPAVPPPSGAAPQKNDPGFAKGDVDPRMTGLSSTGQQ